MKRWPRVLSFGFIACFLIPTIQATAKLDFENQCLRIRLSPGWTVTATGDEVLTLVRGKYVLSINPIFEHASGIIGGRFAEYASATQSIKAVMANVDQPAGGFECAEMPADAIVVSESLSLRNLYTDSSKVDNGCVFPSSGGPVWFGSVFSGPGSESDYDVTLTYSSNEVNDFPRKDSQELRRVFAEVREMLKTLQLKPPIVILKVEPQSAPPGATVKIYGSGFNLFNRASIVQFSDFPNNLMPDPTVAGDGKSVTFQVPTSINTISCQVGRIDVGEFCVPIPADHVDMNDCPPRRDGVTNFCGKPMPPGTYQIWVAASGIISNSASLTVTEPKRRPITILLLVPNQLVSPGDTITLRGSGFAQNGNTVQIGSAVLTDLPSPDGTTITFQAPAPSGLSFVRGIKIYKATVTNAAGQSNSISFSYR